MDLVATSLGRESNIDGEPLLTGKLLENVLDVLGLTSTGGTNEENWVRLLLADKKLKHVAVLDLVGGGDDDLVSD